MKVGIIGCGGITQGNHLPVLQTMPDMRIAWLSDLNAETGRRLARAVGSSFVAAETPLFERPAVDLVLLAIPWGARAQILQALAEMNDGERPALFLEKPVARTVAEHRRILASYADWQVATGLMRRGLPQVACAHKILNSGLFGPLERAAVRFGGLGRILTRGGYMSRLDLAGGGLLIEMGVHYIDTCLYILDARAARFETGRMKTFEGFDLHTEMTFALDVPDGATVPLDLQVTSLEVIESGIDLVFERATVRFDISGRSALDVLPRGGGQPFTLSAGPEYGPDKPLALLGSYWAAFLEGFRARQANYTSAADTLTTTSVIEQAYDNA
jgi:predicted dehydrogenase